MSLVSTAKELRGRAAELRRNLRAGHHVVQGELAEHLSAIADEIEEAAHNDDSSTL